MNATTNGPAPAFAKRPDYDLRMESAPGTVRVTLGGEVVAESAAAVLMHEGKHPPRYYLPRADVRDAALTATDHATHCPFKGDARYWTVQAGGEAVENGAWAYDHPFDECAAVAGLVSFYNERFTISVD